MKLGEAIPKYQAYRNQLQDKKKDIYKQLKNARDKAERTGNDEWTQKAAQLQLSYDKASEDFDKYENALNGLREQWCAASDAENAKALADPETGLGATLEYDDKMYGKAKQAQMIMAALKEKRKEYDSLWDKEGGEYDPEGVADNTQAQGELPKIEEDTGLDSGTDSDAGQDAGLGDAAT